MKYIGFRSICIVVALLFSQSVSINAQDWKSRAKKEGTEYLKKALGVEKPSAADNNKKSPKAKSKADTKKKGKATNMPSAKTSEYTLEQINIVRNFRGPLIQFTGKTLEPCYGGTMDGNWTFPAHTKTEAAQNAWNDQRMQRMEGDEALSNSRLVREIAVAEHWIKEQDKMGGPVREFMATIPSRLDSELYERAKYINDYVEAMTELINCGDDDMRELNYQMRFLDRYLKSPYYQRAIATSLEGLRKYFTAETLRFFEQRGGLQNAHTAQRLTWPGASK